MSERGNGILLHVASLPSPYGIGDMGPEAYRFVDFLARTGQRFWQVLPLNPTDPSSGNSPYVSSSAFAGNPLFISPERMAEDGWIRQEDLSPTLFPDDGRSDYVGAAETRRSLFQIAYERFRNDGNRLDEFDSFCSTNTIWLDDFALFMAARDRFHGQVWCDWPSEIRDREQTPLEDLRNLLHLQVEKHKFLQYLFFQQWRSLRAYCNQKGIRVFGDVPVYVDYNSADLWACPHLFQLDEHKRPCAVSGVPPDYFSETGQLWGNPLYRWDVLKESGYEWWHKRIEHNLALYDLVRIDHFRGFVAYWEVAASEKSAVNGRWIEAPAEDFLRSLFERFPDLPIVAEDLGYITPEVWKVMDRFGIPGMKVLLFAFGDNVATNPYAPHNLVENCLLYTGTHDNNTIRGWFENELSPLSRENIFRYLGRRIPENEIHWEMIRLAMMSVAGIVIIPMQDLLGLGAEARMNIPATAEGNWTWRLQRNEISASLEDRLLEMTEVYGRIPNPSGISAR